MFNMILLQDIVGIVRVEASLFHDLSLLLCLFILIRFVLFLVVIYLSGEYYIKRFSSSDYLEFTWTLVPAFLLYSLGVPSLYLMYFMEGASLYDLTLKVVGHQWYWSYEISDVGEVIFDSYIDKGRFRLLEVDNRVVLPFLSKCRVLVSSRDVLHSWALPSLRLKVDACPGRLNFINVISYKPSVVFRQCSEICGINHSFMPIMVDFVSWDDFILIGD